MRPGACSRPFCIAITRTYHANRKLTIPPQCAIEPSLPPMARQVFDAFVSVANVKRLGEWDWQQLYHFIWHCNAHSVHLSEGDFHRLLDLGGFTTDRAADLAHIYAHGRHLLRQGRK